MRNIRLFCGLVFVFFLILSTGLSFAEEETTRDRDADRAVSEQKTKPFSLKGGVDSLKHAFIDYPIPIVGGVFAGAYYNMVVNDGNAPFEGLALSVPVTVVGMLCQNAFSNLKNKNKKKSSRF